MAVVAKAVVVAAVAAAAAVAVAADAGGKRSTKEEKQNENKLTSNDFIEILLECDRPNVPIWAVLVCVAVVETAAATTSEPTGKTFDTPKQAADALIQGAETFDVAALKEILGPGSDDIISTDDPVADKNGATTFATKSKEKTSIDVDQKNPNLAIISVGNDSFQLPIPPSKKKGSGISIRRGPARSLESPNWCQRVGCDRGLPRLR